MSDFLPILTDADLASAMSSLITYVAKIGKDKNIIS